MQYKITNIIIILFVLTFFFIHKTILISTIVENNSYLCTLII